MKIVLIGFSIFLVMLGAIMGCASSSDNFQAIAVAPTPTFAPLVFPVTILMDDKYANRGEGVYANYDATVDLVKSMSDYFEEKLNIRFTIVNDETKKLVYVSPSLALLKEGEMELLGTQFLTDRAAHMYPSNGTIVIIISGTNLKGRNPGGSLITKRRGFDEYYVLIWADSENPRNGLIHEMAHHFGAKHTYETWGEEYMRENPSIMNPVFDEVFRVEDIDPNNWEILQKRTLDTIE